MENIKQTILLCFILIISSCGKKASERELQDSEQNITSEGTYWARLVSVNPKISKTVSGEIQIQHYGDEFKVKSKLKNASAKTHKQYLHSGSLCPHIDHDVNHDGIIDANESSDPLGTVIIPFDGDISNLELGADNFPSGNFTYEQSTSFSLMISDSSFNTNQFALERRVVSVWEDVEGGEVPIACGILTKISNDSDSSGSGNTWDNSPSSGGTYSGKLPRHRPRVSKPTVNNEPPIQVEPPRERGNIFRRLSRSVRAWASRVFSRRHREQIPSGKLQKS